LDTHNFVLVLSGISEPDDRIEDALFLAGCDDAILAFRNGVAYLEFDREADTLESAVLSAVKNVERAKHQVAVSHVEPDDVVNASEIARRLQWTREYVRLLSQGSRGEGGFPSPLAGVTGTTILWSWAAVLRWLLEQGKLADKSRLTNAETIRDINRVLSFRMHPSVVKRHRDLLRKLRASG
jgi:hypothetical protein